MQADASRGPRSHWAAGIWQNIPMQKTATLATASGVLRGAQIGIQNADGEIRAHGLRRTHRHRFCNNVLQHFKLHKPSVEVCWCDDGTCAGEAWILSLSVPYRYRLPVCSWAAQHLWKRPYLIAMRQCVIFSGTVLARSGQDDFSEASLPSKLHQGKRLLPFNLILDGLIINEQAPQSKTVI